MGISARGRTPYTLQMLSATDWQMAIGATPARMASQWPSLRPAPVTSRSATLCTVWTVRLRRRPSREGRAYWSTARCEWTMSGSDPPQDAGQPPEHAGVEAQALLQVDHVEARRREVPLHGRAQAVETDDRDLVALAVQVRHQLEQHPLGTADREAGDELQDSNLRHGARGSDSANLTRLRRGGHASPLTA